MRKVLLEFLESTGQLDLQTIILRMAVATLVGFLIYLSYMLSHEGSIYSRKFNVSLMALTVITTAVMIVIGNNIALSLGMVGALSIVRFRTAIKEPSDIAFLFWSIAAGIVLAAGFIPLAVLGSLFIGVILVIFSRYKSFEQPYILVVHCENGEAEQNTRAFVTARVRRLSLKSKSVSPGCIELNYELRLKDDNTDFINELAEMPGVSHTVMVSYNGDYMS